MKIEASKDALLKAVSSADSVVSSKAVNAVLMNCLFNVFNDEIEIMATDKEIGIRTRIAASADAEGTFMLSGRRFANIVRDLPEGVIELSVDDRHVVQIRSQSGKVSGQYSIIGTSGENFPEIPRYGDEDVIEIEQAAFRRMIRRVIYAASTDTVKAVFNGVYFVTDEPKTISAVASDSRRLAMNTMSSSGGSDIAQGVILPLKAVREVNSVLGTDGVCRFFIGKNQCFFSVGNTEIVTRTIEGTFPNYSQVIPREYRFRIGIAREPLMESLRRAVNFTVEPVNKIVLRFEGSRLTIEARSPDFGESEENIVIETVPGDPIELGVNALYLIDALKEIDTDVVRVGVTGSKSPMTIAPDNDDRYISVIMPLSVKSE